MFAFFLATSIIGWIVPVILLFVSLAASAIFVGAAVSVLDGLLTSPGGTGSSGPIHPSRDAFDGSSTHAG